MLWACPRRCRATPFPPASSSKWACSGPTSWETGAGFRRNISLFFSRRWSGVRRASILGSGRMGFDHWADPARTAGPRRDQRPGRRARRLFSPDPDGISRSDHPAPNPRELDNRSWGDKMGIFLLIYSWPTTPSRSGPPAEALSNLALAWSHTFDRGEPARRGRAPAIRPDEACCGSEAKPSIGPFRSVCPGLTPMFPAGG